MQDSSAKPKRAEPPPVETHVQTTTPMPTPEPGPIGKPFTVLIKNSFLFDPTDNRFAKALSSEEGIHLAAFGTIRNNTDRIIYRGGAYAKLETHFPRRTEVERHSMGFGFQPPITSQNPWRPNEWRDFQVVTRSMDPIYIEYTPWKITAELSIEARDPLDFRYENTLGPIPVEWQTLLGVKVTGKAKVAEGADMILDKASKKVIAADEDVDLIFLYAGGYKIATKDGRRAWVRYSDLVFDNAASVQIVPSPPSFPRTAKNDRFSITVNSLAYKDKLPKLPQSTYGWWVADIQIDTLVKGSVTVKAAWFDLDLSGKTQDSYDAGKVKDAFDDVKLSTDDTRRGLLYFKAEPKLRPVELEFAEPGKPVMAVDISTNPAE